MDREDLELEIFAILTADNIETLADQKDICRKIARLFPPHYLTLYAMRGIVEQLLACDFVCEATPLRLNTAFIALCELAEYC